MNRSYTVRQSVKTKLLNIVRRLFTFSVVEKFIRRRTLQKPNGIFRKLIPPDYLYRKGSYRLVTRGTITYKLDISNVVDHYLYFGIADANYSSIESNIRNASVILDIGANIGTTSLYFASMNQQAQILAFEPHPQTFARAKENVELNLFKNIDLVNIGLGEKKEKVKLYEVNVNNPGMNRILQVEKDYPFKLIAVEKLDDFLQDKNIAEVNLIKLDVEGFEISVLKGAEKTIRANKPLLFIELDDDNLRENGGDAAAMIQLLVSFGYSKIFRAVDSVPLTLTTDFRHAHYDIIAE